MKIRKGFVSNSSSSSYIVLLPEDFEKELPEDELVDIVNKLVTEKELWEYEEDGEIYDVLLEKLNRYIVAELDGGPDSGKIVIANPEKVRTIINEG